MKVPRASVSVDAPTRLLVARRFLHAMFAMKASRTSFRFSRSLSGNLNLGSAPH
jgi:hypothetical protein